MMNLFRICLLAISFSAPSFVKAEVNYPYPEKKKIFINNEYNSRHPKEGLRIINPDKSAWLIQAWAENEQREKYPVVYPPLTRLEKYESIYLKIYENDIAKSNISWFIVKIIPSTDKAVNNRITIPVIYRIKIEYKNSEEQKT